MISTRGRLLWTLTRRFARRGTGAWPVTLTTCAAALVVAVFIALQSLSLSGQQEIDKRLGSFESTASLGAVLSLSASDAGAVPAIASAARSVDDQAIVVLQSYDVEPAVADPATTYYYEAPWAQQPFAERYHLTDGRWPNGPGEIVVAQTSTGSLALTGQRLPVLAGGASLEVVGLFDDRFGNYRSTILAAPGTFATFDGQTSAGSTPAQALPSLYWRGANSDKLLAAVADQVGEQYGLAPREVRETLQASTESTYDVAAAREGSAVTQVPAVYLVPSILLPAVATLGAFALLRRRHHRAHALLVQVGVPSRTARGALGLASSVWIAVGLVVGMLAGVLLGVGLRRYLAGATFQPLSPMPDLTQPMVTLLIVTAASCVVAALSLRPARAPAPGFAPGAPRDAGARAGGILGRGSRLLVNARHGLATVLFCASLLLVSQLSSTVRAMILAALVTTTLLLLTPEIVAAALRAAPSRGARTRLARQQLRADPARATLAVIVMSTSLALPLGFVMLLGTLSATAATNAGQSTVGPGQVAIAGLGGTLEAPPGEVVQTARGSGALPEDGIRLAYLSQGPNSSPFGVDGAGLGVVWVLDSTADFAALREAAASSQEQATLNEGGILVWDAQQGATRDLVDGDGRPLPGEPLPALTSTTDPAWEQGAVGVILSQTARTRSLPTTEGALVFTDVNDKNALQARDAVLNARLDPAQVQIYSAPEPPYVPQAFRLGTIALLLIGFLTAMVFSRAQVQALRRYLNTLTALGLPRRWVRQVLLLQNSWLVAIASAIAFSAAFIPTALSANIVPGFVLDFPWIRLATIAVAFLASILLATMASIGQLKAADRGV